MTSRSLARRAEAVLGWALGDDRRDALRAWAVRLYAEHPFFLAYIAILTAFSLFPLLTILSFLTLCAGAVASLALCVLLFWTAVAACALFGSLCVAAAAALLVWAGGVWVYVVLVWVARVWAGLGASSSSGDGGQGKEGEQASKSTPTSTSMSPLALPKAVLGTQGLGLAATAAEVEQRNGANKQVNGSSSGLASAAGDEVGDEDGQAQED